MKPPDGFCPCGCGIRTCPPINVQNIWHNAEPYWAWYCTREGCTRFQVEQKNQSGDPVCPWCGAQRQLVGHIAKATQGGRVTVSGNFIKYPEGAAHRYLRPYKTEGSEYGNS